jgi:uncharacterized membrane protein
VNSRWGRRLQFAAACGLIAAYAGFSHYCNTAGADHDWSAVPALAPLTLILTVLMWRSVRPAVAWLLTAVLAGALWKLWPVVKSHYPVFFFVQETTLYSLLALTFARTLLPGRIALCTRLADKVHGPLSPRELWYTRRVTAAWALFFVAVALVSLLLFTLAPLRVWSAFINFCVLPLGVTLFVIETLVVRRRVLPQVKGSGLLDTVRVYLATPH